MLPQRTSSCSEVVRTHGATKVNALAAGQPIMEDFRSGVIRPDPVIRLIIRDFGLIYLAIFCDSWDDHCNLVHLSPASVVFANSSSFAESGPKPCRSWGDKVPGLAFRRNEAAQ